MRRSTWLATLLCLATWPALGAGPTGEVAERIDWQGFLARHDLVWDCLPRAWYEGPFLGNGMVGTMIYQDGARAIRWDVGRADVQDHRDDSFGMSMYSRPRLPIGYFTLETAGEIRSGNMRLDLWNGDAVGMITTNRGTITWRTAVHADEMVILVALEPTAGERDCRWQWHPAEAISPRQAFGRRMEGYKPNPPHRMEKADDVDVCTQPLLAGGETATAWHVGRQAETTILLYASVAHSFPGATAGAAAVDTVNRARKTGFSRLIDTNRDWWHAYYPASFLSITDTRWESFYWIQMYKLACATRADRALIDNQGPWLQQTPWPGAWWNLNVQLSYWPVYASNRLDLGESLCKALDRNTDNLIRNVPEAYRKDSAGIGRATGQDCRCEIAVGPSVNASAPELCNLPWACHNYWLQYRFSMDDAMLRDRLFPLLRRSMNLYLRLLEKGDDGRLHLPRATSPEYGEAQDCNIDLALLRWGCQTLIETCGRLKIDDPLLPRWREVLEKLTPYPVNANGFMIGRDVPFAKSHRHFSHLLMIYPLYLVNTDRPGDRDLIAQSLKHWQGLDQALAGYSHTGAASIAAGMREGNESLRHLNGLNRFLKPNTMYQESGPCIETPLAAAQSIHDMLIQSWGGTIRVFPAVPDAWPDAVIHNFRAEGAFLVSAVRRRGKTQFVRIKSLAGEPCRLSTDMASPLRRVGKPDALIEIPSSGVISLNLGKDEEVVLHPAADKPDCGIAPVSAQPEQRNRFGLRVTKQ